MSGLSRDTIKKISNTKRHYNARLSVIESLCAALDVSLAQLLEWRR
jgi:DNA-binding Xre family transcriptional regulator